MTIGGFFIGWLPSDQQRHNELLKKIRQIMANQKDLTADVARLTDQLTTTNARLATLTTAVTKVGTETDGLNKTIKDLQDALANQDNASPELVAAVEALKAQAATQATAVDNLSTGITAVDDKVPDAT